MKDYIETISGAKVWLPDPDPESIRIEDIAHSLSFQPRFAGHLQTLHSVAAHSLLVEDMVHEGMGIDDRVIRLQALLHDATEAYLCDIPTPFKRLLPDYRKLEKSLWLAIAARFGVPEEKDPAVKTSDMALLYAERNLFRGPSEWVGEPPEDETALVVTRIIRNLGRGGQSPEHIKGLFLSVFRSLEV